MNDDQTHLAEFFRRGVRTPEQASDAEETLPANDDAYSPFSRRSNKPEFSLHFITPAGTMRSFQYAHLDSDSGFTAECITLRFMGLVPMKVLIHGRNLRPLYDGIHQHRTLWVREAARAFAGDNEPIVTKVKFEPVKEPVENLVED